LLLRRVAALPQSKRQRLVDPRFDDHAAAQVGLEELGGVIELAGLEQVVGRCHDQTGVADLPLVQRLLPGDLLVVVDLERRVLFFLLDEFRLPVLNLAVSHFPFRITVIGSDCYVSPAGQTSHAGRSSSWGTWRADAGPAAVTPDA